ncbi:type II secretion system protein [PVC group bacterium]|nr:type II secretion system protein [PVC group bacterium]
MNASLAQAQAVIGADVEEIIASIGNEGFFSIQLSPDKTVDIPLPSATPVTIPVPSFLCGIEIRNETIPNLVTTQITNVGLPVIATTVKNSSIRSINLPIPSPVPIVPAYAMHSGYFLIGSTPDTVKNAIIAFETGNGLLSTLGFKKKFAGLPMRNNGIAYVDAKFGKLITEIQKQMISSIDVASANSTERDISSIFMNQAKPQSCALIIENLNNGIAVKGTTTASGAQIAAATTVVPTVGLLAAIAIPSFTKSRNKAKSIHTANNGRQIHLAIFDASMEAAALDMPEVWPTEANYKGKTSTQFFKDAVSSNWIEGVDAAFFAAPGIVPEENISVFAQANNAWCVTLGLSDSTPASTPFIFTKNIGTSGGSAPANSTLNTVNGLMNIDPFGEKTCVIITKGGAVKILPRKLFSQDRFNPSGSDLNYIVP